VIYLPPKDFVMYRDDGWDVNSNTILFNFYYSKLVEDPKLALLMLTSPESFEREVVKVFQKKVEIESVERLKVVGDLNLRSSSIAVLPDGLEVSGCLDLEYSKIVVLPKSLKVGVYLEVSHTPIAVLPDGLEVGWWLGMYETKITSLPDDLKVGMEIWMSEDMKLEYVPEHLKNKVSN